MKTIASAVALAKSIVLSSHAAHADMVDPALPAYKAASGVSGNLKSIGSDTLNNLMMRVSVKRGIAVSVLSSPCSRSVTGGCYMGAG